MKNETKQIINLNLEALQEQFEGLQKQIDKAVEVLRGELKFRCNINKKEMQNIMNDMKGEVAPPLEMGLLEFEKFSNISNKYLFENEYFKILTHLNFTLKSYQKSIKFFDHISQNVDVLSNASLCRNFVTMVYFQKLLDKNTKFLQALKGALIQQEAKEICM